MSLFPPLQKNAPLLGDLGLPYNTWFLGLPVHIPNATSIGSTIFVGPMAVTNVKQTHAHRS